MSCSQILGSVSRCSAGSIRRIDLLNPSFVATTFKFSVKPGLHRFDAFLIAHEARRKYEHVGVVVPARERPDLRFPRQRRTNTWIAIGNDVHSYPTAAEQNSSLRFACGDLLRKRVRIIGVIVRYIGILSCMPGS